MNAMTPAERFAVALTPAPTAARIARQRSVLRLQVIFALVFGAVLLLVWRSCRRTPGRPCRGPFHPGASLPSR